MSNLEDVEKRCKEEKLALFTKFEAVKKEMHNNLTYVTISDRERGREGKRKRR